MLIKFKDIMVKIPYKEIYLLWK